MKKEKHIKCAKCDLEFPETTLSEKHRDKAFSWENQILCKDCLVKIGGDPNTTPLWDFTQKPQSRHDW